MKNKIEISSKEIYLNAAKQIFFGNQKYSCIAIDRQVHHWKYNSLARRLYEKTMHQNDNYSGILISDVDFATPDPRNFRVWLLCMMAACCDDMKRDSKVTENEPNPE